MYELWMSLVGLSMTASSYAQVVNIKQRGAHGVSIIFWLVLLHGQAWWIFYGIHRHSISIIITNVVGVILSSWVVTLIVKERR